MGDVRGGQPKTFTIGTTAVLISHTNKARASVTILATSTNAGIVYVGYDDPGVASSGAHKGIPMASGAQITEIPPAIFTGEIWAIGSAPGQEIQVVETTDYDVVRSGKA